VNSSGRGRGSRRSRGLYPQTDMFKNGGIFLYGEFARFHTRDDNWNGLGKERKGEVADSTGGQDYFSGCGAGEGLGESVGRNGQLFGRKKRGGRISTDP